VCDVPAGTDAGATLTHAAANGCSETSAPVAVVVNTPPSKPTGAPSNPVCADGPTAEVTATFTLPNGANLGDALSYTAPPSYTSCDVMVAGGKGAACFCSAAIHKL
jgi:hypothetical protein